jgi:hypothetical protein
MQAAIEALARLGPLPGSDVATVDSVRAIEDQLSLVRSPVSDEEAKVLVKLFGPDDCFGLAWTLVHLIESSPSWPIEEAMSGVQGERINLLRGRAA